MMAAGVVLVLASLLVDVVGVGTDGFGVGQAIGLVVGIGLVGAGIWDAYFRQPTDT